MEMVRGWIYYGRIQDHYNEFMISKSDNYSALAGPEALDKVKFDSLFWTLSNEYFSVPFSCFFTFAFYYYLKTYLVFHHLEFVFFILFSLTNSLFSAVHH